MNLNTIQLTDDELKTLQVVLDFFMTMEMDVNPHVEETSYNWETLKGVSRKVGNDVTEFPDWW